ncbi:MAG: hypothetical protein JNM82_06420, partial [Rhodocyclaceae bacterium]|nr:hypothetical protein [Rhodocyclaceae bacterium]
MTSAAAFRPLAGIYEPSAIQQLPDGRFLVVEDEKEHPFSLVTLGADGGVAVVPLDAGELPKLDDLEGLTLDPAGRVCAITSHSRRGNGEEKKSRQRLVRFRVAGDRAVGPAVVEDLKPALAAAHPALAAAAARADAKSAEGFNIEGLEMSPDGARLLVGLRSPLDGGRALVAAIENPPAMFDDGQAPRVGGLSRLDLGGDGIRALSWLPGLAGYLLVGGPVDREPRPFRLWWWAGPGGGAARPVALAAGDL